MKGLVYKLRSVLRTRSFICSCSKQAAIVMYLFSFDMVSHSRKSAVQQVKFGAIKVDHIDFAADI